MPSAPDLLGRCALALGALLASGCGGADGPRPVANRFGIRHVVLISIDTLRADRLGCYGHRLRGESPSPAVDGLAERGVLLERHFSAATTTLSSHTSLMTGTYPHTHGVPRNGFVVAEGNVMLAEILARAGFATACFIGAAPLMDAVGFPQGFLHYDFRYSRDADGSPSGHQRRADEVTDAVLGWLDEGGATRARSPLFLFVHYFDVHAPYDAPPPFRGRYAAGTATGAAGTVSANAPDAPQRARQECLLEGMDGGPLDAAFDPGFLAALERARPGALDLARRLDQEYCAEIAFTDHHLGRLLDGLRERGVLDDALVVLTSDHGETFQEHTPLFSHGESVFDTEIHTP